MFEQMEVDTGSPFVEEFEEPVESNETTESKEFQESRSADSLPPRESKELEAPQELVAANTSTESKEFREPNAEDSQEPKESKELEGPQESTTSTVDSKSELPESLHEKATSDVQATEGTDKAPENVATSTAPLRLSGVRLVIVEIW